MNAISRRGDVRPDRRLRFPALPVADSAGTSFKHEHLNAILAESPQAGFFEVHAENYMGAGGPPHQALERIRRDHPVSLHGVCMSIGGPQPLDRAHLARFRALVERYEPALVSEHLAWSTHETTYFNDLLPLPYTQATLAHVCEHIDEVQNAIGRLILIENPSTYVAFASSTMSETDFIRAITCRTGCGLLLDVNNVFVSATNHGHAALDYLSDFPLAGVGEIHLAGHAEQLAATYPAVQRITGVEFFRAMARFHVRATPPISPLLFEYGRDFPAFIEGYEPAQDIPWLADTARIERAWLDAYHAADVPPLSPDVLAAVPSDRLGDLVFTAHPAACIVRSVYPAVAIFAMNRVEGPITPLRSNAAEDALITRPDMEVAARLLPPGGAAFLKTLIDGGTLGAAAASAFDETPSFDLPANIAGMIEAGVFTIIHLGDRQ